MRIAIFSRPGECFPNIISQGLSDMLDQLDIENKIFYDAIPFLMRLLPISKKPKRWHNNLHFRLRNKLINYFHDRNLIKELNNYDAVILSECYPNAFWKNYMALEEFKNIYKGKFVSYTESPVDAAPLNKMRHLDENDFGENVYDYNLFVTDTVEVRKEVNKDRQAVIGFNISNAGLSPLTKKEFSAVIDFAQPGYESYRELQLKVLKNLGIKTIVLDGKYTIEDIRKIYKEAAIFFISFPETIGLPIAECFASGTFIFTPDSSWPMSWRLNEYPLSMGPGVLPDCFKVYKSECDLSDKLTELIKTYDIEKTPAKIANTFWHSYPKFYHGDKNALKELLNKFSF